MTGIKIYELISLLTDYCDPRAEVIVEGCDCEGNAAGVVPRYNNRACVLITRTDGDFSDETITPSQTEK